MLIFWGEIPPPHDRPLQRQGQGKWLLCGPDFTQVPRLYLKQVWEKTGEKLGKPLELCEYTTILWGSMKKTTSQKHLMRQIPHVEDPVLCDSHRKKDRNVKRQWISIQSTENGIILIITPCWKIIKMPSQLSWGKMVLTLKSQCPHLLKRLAMDFSYGNYMLETYSQIHLYMNLFLYCVFRILPFKLLQALGLLILGYLFKTFLTCPSSIAFKVAYDSPLFHCVLTTTPRSSYSEADSKWCNVAQQAWWWSED